jgi:transcriptional regulator with XRE-family HTH domain
MSISISENLKKLRRSRDLTQEELAEIIGVSAQSISKWERGDNYPDITLLPAIANYFEVTVDDLLGMNAIRDERRIETVKARRIELMQASKYGEALEITRELARDLPNDFAVQLMYAQSMDLNRLMGVAPQTSEEALAQKQPVIAIYERILAKSTDDAIRYRANAGIASIYYHIGEYDKAYEYADRLGLLGESREKVRSTIEMFAAGDYTSAGRSLGEQLGIDMEAFKDLDEKAQIMLINERELAREENPPHFELEEIEKYTSEMRGYLNTLMFDGQIALNNYYVMRKQFGIAYKAERIDVLKAQMSLLDIAEWGKPIDEEMHASMGFNLALEYANRGDDELALEYVVKAIDATARHRDEPIRGTTGAVDDDGNIYQVPLTGALWEHAVKTYERPYFDNIRDRPEFVAAMARLRGEAQFTQEEQEEAK